MFHVTVSTAIRIRDQVAWNVFLSTTTFDSPVVLNSYYARIWLGEVLPLECSIITFRKV